MLLKGAIVSVPWPVPIPNLIFFQYNPVTVSRTLNTNYYAESGESVRRSRGPIRMGGAPAESVSMELQLDCFSGLDAGNPLDETVGLRPQLAALELLTYPHLANVIMNEALFAAGTIEAVPMRAPFNLFIFGPSKVAPVKIDSLTITEQAFNSLLVPIRATVSITMSVVSYTDVLLLDPNFFASLGHHTALEVSAAILKAQQAAAAVKGLGLDKAVKALIPG